MTFEQCGEIALIREAAIEGNLADWQAVVAPKLLLPVTLLRLGEQDEGGLDELLLSVCRHPSGRSEHYHGAVVHEHVIDAHGLVLEHVHVFERWSR